MCARPITPDELEMVATWAAMREDLNRLRAVWRAVVAEWEGGDVPDAIVAAVIAVGLADEQRDDAGSVTVLTPDGERLARGGA